MSKTLMVTWQEHTHFQEPDGLLVVERSPGDQDILDEELATKLAKVGFVTIDEETQVPRVERVVEGTFDG